MIAHASPPCPRLPTIFSTYQPIEEFWNECGPVQEFGPEPDSVFNPLDAFLTHILLDLLPQVPVVIDLAIEATGGASSVLALIHPHVQAVVAGAGSKTASSEQAFRALDSYRRRHRLNTDLDVRPLADLLEDTSFPAGAVVLVDARTLEPDVLAAAVSCWSASQRDVSILLFGLGTLGVCPALDAVLRVCPVQGTRRLWLARELEGALSASGLAVIAPEAHPRAADILFRVQQLYTTNHHFLDLLRVANQAALEAANLDAEIMKSHPSSWALTTELRQARERHEDAHRQLVEAQARAAELQQALQRSGDELARTTSQFIEVQKSLAFRLASRVSGWRARLAPEQSWRYRFYQKSIGFGRLLSRAARKCLVVCD